MRYRQQGLTLVELMVTLAVAIILLAVGMPLFSGVAANNRAVAQTNALVTALNLARSEAVARAAAVSVAATGGSWNNGWFVFVDTDADGTQDAGETTVRLWEAPAGNPAISGSAITFGFSGAASSTGSFQLNQSGTTGSTARCVTVMATGQIRTKRQKAGESWSCP